MAVVNHSMSKNYFKMLGLEAKFEINAAELEAKYLEEQSKYHPDSAPKGSEMEYIQKAADINEAYKILKYDLTRAEHLLALSNVTVNLEEGSIQPSALILEGALADREKLEGLKKVKAIEEILVAKEHARELLLRMITKSLAEERLEDTAEQVIELRYMDKFILEVKSKVKSLRK